MIGYKPPKQNLSGRSVAVIVIASMFILFLFWLGTAHAGQAQPAEPEQQSIRELPVIRQAPLKDKWFRKIRELPEPQVVENKPTPQAAPQSRTIVTQVYTIDWGEIVIATIPPVAAAAVGAWFARRPIVKVIKGS